MMQASDSAIDNVAEWLRRLGLGHHEKKFLRHDIDVEVLKHLDEIDLVKIGIDSLGDRKRILHEAKRSAPAKARTFSSLADHVRALAVLSAAVAGIGSFSLYLFGYLALRARLTALGIQTDLDFVDERYLSEGANFFLYSTSVLTNLLLIIIFLGVLVSLIYLIVKFICRIIFNIEHEDLLKFLTSFKPWKNLNESHLALLGVVISVFTIQILSKKAFNYSNVLLTPIEFNDFHMSKIYMEKFDIYTYFHLLVVLNFLVAILFFASRSSISKSKIHSNISILLVLLLAMQTLFLPINYGVLVRAGTNLPRITEMISGNRQVIDKPAWLAWEGAQSFTLLVEDVADFPGNQRAFITVDKKDVDRIVITCVDNVIERHLAPSFLDQIKPRSGIYEASSPHDSPSAGCQR